MKMTACPLREGGNFLMKDWFLMQRQSYAPLSGLPVGGAARVRALRLSGGIRRRVQDLGLVCGTRVTCLHRAAAGDPSAYLIRGAVIALRAQDAAQIEIEVIE